MTEPTRLTEAELERLLKLAEAVKNYHVPSDGIAAIDDYLAATRPPTLRALVEEVRRLRADYFDLIDQVQTKHPHESRHETAKRYIHERENQPAKAAQAEARDAS